MDLFWVAQMDLPGIGFLEHLHKFLLQHNHLLDCKDNYPKNLKAYLKQITHIIYLTSSKQSNKHSGVLIMGPFPNPNSSISQSQKQSSLPPVVIPHIGSSSSLYLGVDKSPERSYLLINPIQNCWVFGSILRNTDNNCPMNAIAAVANISELSNTESCLSSRRNTSPIMKTSLFKFTFIFPVLFDS